MLRKAMVLLAAGALGGGLLNAPAAEAAPAADGKRVVVYYQTQYVNGVYVSPKAMTDNTTGVTNVLVGAIHLDPDVVHLNDDPPEAAKFTQMWADLHAMQAKGVKVSAFVGGAAQGSFQRLDTEFDKYYPRLKNLVTTYGLDGLDLDVEENMSQAGINRLIDQLTTDFGTGFVITLAPVATALSGGGNLSGFNYETLERDRGAKIDWYNAQFYCGWGSMASTTGYDNIINRGLFTPNKVVTGVVTNSANCGGYVELPTLKNTLGQLVAKYPTFGGVDGWEYFNSDPGGTAAPWQWAREMTSAMSGGSGGPGNLALNKPATGSGACAPTEGPAKAVNGTVSGGNADKSARWPPPSSSRSTSARPSPSAAWRSPTQPPVASRPPSTPATTPCKPPPTAPPGPPGPPSPPTRRRSRPTPSPASPPATSASTSSRRLRAQTRQPASTS
jgi:hypothetical protein